MSRHSRSSLLNSVTREMLIDELGDVNSSVWSTFSEGVLLTIYLKASKKDKKLLLNSIKSGDDGQILKLASKYVTKKDLKLLAQHLREQVYDSALVTLDKNL